MQVKDLTIEEFRALVRDTVEDALQELIDPDQGLSVKTEVKEALLRTQELRLAGRLTVSAEAVMQELGLK